MLHVVTIGAYYPPVFTTWKILTTAASQLTAGPLCRGAKNQQKTGRTNLSAVFSLTPTPLMSKVLNCSIFLELSMYFLLKLLQTILILGLEESLSWIGSSAAMSQLAGCASHKFHLEKKKIFFQQTVKKSLNIYFPLMVSNWPARP